MNGADASERKHDTASIYSMDSAYQSQSGASRRGIQMPEDYQTLTPQDNLSRANTQFLGGDVYSPTLSPDNFRGFPEQPSDMGTMETGESSFAYTNYTTGQDYSQYTTTSVPRWTPSTEMDVAYWGAADAHNFGTPFTYTPLLKPTNSLDATFYSGQNASEMMFNAPAPPQRQLSRPGLDTASRPSVVRSSSSFSLGQQGSRRQSTNESNFAAFVMSPASAISAQLPNVGPGEFEQYQRTEKEETVSTSLTAQSLNDEDDLLSPADAAEAKTMEEEQGKLARSHILYQAQADADGKYHCPNEGKSGCNHKPTPLKCNYDKYVDSHLKPFRCNKKVCVGVQFSSTACLLRHEREAHGMHGHGSRPHLCHFVDCERSAPGNGFPRRYNLFDHMKRVHDFTGPTTEPSPPAQQGQPATRKTTPRKRKSAADEPSEKRQKVMKPTREQLALQRRNQLQEDFLSKKQEIIAFLSNLGDPGDFGDGLQLSKGVYGLQEIAAAFKKHVGG